VRKEKGWSLREAAERSGLSHSYIAAVEKGIHPTTKAPIKPSPDSLKAFAKAYNIDYEELLRLAGFLEETGDKQNVDVSRVKARAIELISELPDEDVEKIIWFLDKLGHERK